MIMNDIYLIALASRRTAHDVRSEIKAVLRIRSHLLFVSLGGSCRDLISHTQKKKLTPSRVVVYIMISQRG